MKLLDIEEAKQLFIKSCPEICTNHEIEKFVAFSCPIALIDANVKENLEDEYDSVELLILSLYVYGIKDVESISAITGISKELVSKLLNAEKNLYNHIDENGQLTEAGLQTLVMNEDEKLQEEDKKQFAVYNVKRELQIDALTGSLIKSKAEEKIFFMHNNPASSIVINPLEIVKIDDTLRSEISNRLEEYVDKDYIINAIEVSDYHSKEIKYRIAYYIRIQDFTYPIIGVEFNDYNDEGKPTLKIQPISMANSDYEKISNTETPYIGMADEYFEYLLKNDDKFIDGQEFDENILSGNLVSYVDVSNDMDGTEEDFIDNEAELKQDKEDDNSLGEEHNEQVDLR